MDNRRDILDRCECRDTHDIAEDILNSISCELESIKTKIEELNLDQLGEASFNWYGDVSDMVDTLTDKLDN